LLSTAFGRSARAAFRAAFERELPLDVVAINDIAEAPSLAHLLRRDTVYGKFPLPVELDGERLVVDGRPIRLFSEPDPARLPWAELEVDVVIEATGKFTKRADAEQHLAAGAHKVVISAPAKGADATVVLGVNFDDVYDPEVHHVISNASCTTNCLAPVAKVLHETIGIRHGVMTAVHAYTADQRVVDMPHKDLRRARAAAINLIPTSTGAARAIGLVLPDLKGKVDGMSMRAPVPIGSIVDLVVQVGAEPTAEEVNDLFRSHADTGDLEGILQYTDEPIVSSDIVHSSYSSIFDSDLTMANGPLVKVFSWYDNEWGYSCRLVDLVAKIGATLPAAVGA
jgi:glyceraldehyde 3-phosphate dehydrogenase